MIDFVKYQGSGNDFVLIDNRYGAWAEQVKFAIENLGFYSEQAYIEQLCNRKFGIGADGLILLQTKDGVDFEMIYYNSDGCLSSMCGNGGRCIADWAFSLGIGSEKKSITDTSIKHSKDLLTENLLTENPLTERYKDSLTFNAADGIHRATKIINPKDSKPWISLTMNPKSTQWQLDDVTWELNTGSPHYVNFKNESIENMDLLGWAKEIRYNKTYSSQGINVNAVVELGENQISMRTYERGVEDETLSCGTGVTAAAIAYCAKNSIHRNPGKQLNISVLTKGGELNVALCIDKSGDGYSEILLQGPANFVFKGVI